MTESDRSTGRERLPSSAGGRSPSRGVAPAIALALALIAAGAALAPAGAAGAAAPPLVLVAGLAALLLPLRTAASLGAVGIAAFAVALYAGGAASPTALAVATAATAAGGGVIAAGLRRRLGGPAPATVVDAAVDALTALPNRHGFEQRLQLEIGRLERDPGARLALIICALGGTEEGEEPPRSSLAADAVRAAAQRIGAAVRGVDLTARVGETEFGVILPGVDTGQAAAIAERIRAEVRERLAATEPASARPPVTVRCGIASAPEPEPRPQALLEDAGRALAAARRAGRDAIAVFDGAGAILIGGPYPDSAT